MFNRRSIGAIFAALFVVAGCASTGPSDSPGARNLSWFSYVGGDDIRVACAPGASDSFRLVYNAIYAEQVRSYDIRTTPLYGGAQMEVRVQAPAVIGKIALDVPLVPWEPRLSHRALTEAELTALTGALDASGAFGPPPRGLKLNSGAFYWVVSACRDGDFRFNAFLYPSPRYDGLSFVEVLAGLDDSGIDFNPPRILDRPPRVPGRCSARGDAWDECQFPPFMLEVGDNGFTGYMAF